MTGEPDEQRVSAHEDKRKANKRLDDARRSAARQTVGGRAWKATEPRPDDAGFPRDLPYTALGSLGESFFLLDAAGKFRALRYPTLSNPGTVMSIFAADPGSLQRLYPKYDKTGRILPKRYDQNEAVGHILELVSQAGPFNPAEQVRGRGAWLDRRGEGKDRLVQHLGDRLIVGGRSEALAKLNGFAYAQSGPPLPWSDRRVSAAEGLSHYQWLERQFSQWTWKYPKLAPKLLTGWIAAAALNVALVTRPMIGISGADRWGRQQLLRTVQRLLGYCLIIVREQDTIDDLVGWDGLPVLISQARRAVAPQRFQRKASWAAETARAAPYDGMRFCTSETAQVLNLSDDPGYLELALSGIPFDRLAALATSDECAVHLPALRRRMSDQFQLLRASVLPACIDFLRELDGVETATAFTVGSLLAAAWVLHRDDVPTGRDFEALNPELDLLVLGEHEERVPPYLQLCHCLFDVRVEPRDETVRGLIAVAAGLCYPRNDGERWTEERAIRHSQSDDPTVKRAAQLLGMLGFRVHYDEKNDPGYRLVAVAYSTPAREQLLERTGFARLVAQGLTVKNTLSQAPNAVVHGSTVRFHSIGPRHCILLPLDFVIGPAYSDDPEGTPRLGAVRRILDRPFAPSLIKVAIGGTGTYCLSA